MSVRSLYICYFGLREPLVQTQVLPYLRELVAGGVAMSLLTFEPEMKKRWTAAAIAEWRQRLRAEGIEWHLLPYHKRPTLPATLYDIARGAWRAAKIARRERVDLIHARSHVAAAMGALAKRMTGARLIFDFRGFLAEEYVDRGDWRAGGLLYRLTKRAERWLLRSADGMVVLTERAKRELGCAAIEVIPCCVEAARFADAADSGREVLRGKLALAGRVVYIYIGALGGYYLVRETAELFAAARAADPRAYALVLTQGRPEEMAAALERAGLAPDDYRVLSAPPAEVPRYLHAADVAVSLIRASYPRLASSPTKFAEYLAAGLPVISTAGIGDLDVQIEQERVGVLVRELDRAALDDAVRAIGKLRRDPELAERCREVARRLYDLHDVGGVRYRRLYDTVLGR
jgi:glycosyltransferase involved in cell wall biosynthesis